MSAPKFVPPEDESIKITAEGIERFRNDYQALIDTIEASGANVLVSTQMMAGLPNCEPMDRYLGDTPQQIQTNSEIAQAITDAVREVAAANDLPFADIAADVPCNDSLLGDSIHLTREGHRVVAEAWADHFQFGSY
ncbi:GDSL-type esterase/lipase family protein [Neorhodopirellula pilleata]|nr:GDSL-type esterase/lipase family protein [Neorhodopirellula pilleata]